MHFQKEEQEIIVLNNELLGKIFILSLEEVCNSEFDFVRIPKQNPIQGKLPQQNMLYQKKEM